MANLNYIGTAKFNQESEQGVKVISKQLLLVNCATNSDAEQRIYKWLEVNAREGEKSVPKTGIARYSEMHDTDKELLFDVIIEMIICDEQTAKEKKSKTLILIGADDILKAGEKAIDLFEKTNIDFSIVSLKLSPISEVLELE